MFLRLYPYFFYHISAKAQVTRSLCVYPPTQKARVIHIINKWFIGCIYSYSVPDGEIAQTRTT